LLELSLANFTQDVPLPAVAIRGFIYKSRKRFLREFNEKSIFLSHQVFLKKNGLSTFKALYTLKIVDLAVF
jgi:hypothetical protein